MFDGQWFAGQRIQFEGGFVAPPVSGGAGYSFNMTAGNFSAGLLIGYSPGLTGSIDAEPIPTNPLNGLFSGTIGNGIGFNDGDITGLLAGLTVWINGVQYAANFSGWSYDGGGDATSASWSSGGPTFVGGNSYFVEIK